MIPTIHPSVLSVSIRVHDWERSHHEWRTTAIRNERYRRDAQGHEHPWRDHDSNRHDHDGH